MSADTTIGILVTQSKYPCRGDFEYRVALVQAIENIECNADYPSRENAVLNVAAVRELFAKAPVYYNADMAHRYAAKLEARCARNGTIVEYGVMAMRFETVKFPVSERKRARSRRHITRRVRRILAASVAA